MPGHLLLWQVRYDRARTPTTPTTITTPTLTTTKTTPRHTFHSPLSRSCLELKAASLRRLLSHCVTQTGYASRIRTHTLTNPSPMRTRRQQRPAINWVVQENMLRLHKPRPVRDFIFFFFYLRLLLITQKSAPRETFPNNAKNICMYIDTHIYMYCTHICVLFACHSQ